MDFLSQVRRALKPTQVVCIGDEIDAHSWSRYPKNPEMPGPREEMDLARKALQPLYRLFPKVAVCVSNHTHRPAARAREIGLIGAFLADIRTVLGAPSGWSWAWEWEFDGVRFVHGEGCSGADGHLKAARAAHQNTVIGHLHTSAGVAYATLPRGRVWGMQVSTLIDPTSPAFEYARHAVNKPNLGCGIIDGGTPVYLPFGVLP